jgi:DNA uptake protein ComE-like DNA-binding protein
MTRRKRLVYATTLSLVLALGVANTLKSQVGKNLGVLNPNLAGEKELLALPPLNAKLVKQILDKRPFLSMTALDTLLRQSLSREQLAEFYPKLFIPINLNTATREEILLVPGVGKRMAHEFEEYRPYRALAQFHREIGKYVDEKEVARLEQFVFVPINLNTASDEDILSIPGVGKRMLHEFKEYRPYKNLEQFRREIGKYVDKKEVARLERYVTLE